MKKKYLILALTLILCFTLKIDVKAVTVLKNDVKNDTYIIGKYMYTRDNNNEYNYEGRLTTNKIMLASKTADEVYEQDMIIYYKDLFGTWKNGLTGDPIEVPDYFEIVNRNFHELLGKPTLSCDFSNEDSSNSLKCHSYLVKDQNAIESDDVNASIKFYTEYYKIVDASGNGVLNPIYNEDHFENSNGDTLNIIKIEGSQVDLASNLSIVSRIYFEDESLSGDYEKIYSDYSNVETNAFEMSNIPVTDIPTLIANIVPVAIEIDEINPLDVKYYNVEFSFEGLDTTKYEIRSYKVYTNINQFDRIEFSGDIAYALNSTEAHKKLWDNNLESDKYSNPFYIQNHGYNYLTAEIVSNENVSDQRIHSIRLDDRSGNVKYIAQIELCDKNQNTCYHTFTRNLITANPSFIVRFMDGDTLIESQVVAENHKVIAPYDPEKVGFAFQYWSLELGGEAFDLNTPITEDITLYANYTELESFTVTFKDGDRIIDVQTVFSGSRVDEPEDVTKLGFDLDKWMLGDSEFDFETLITSDLVINATWTQKNYTVTKTYDETSETYKLDVYEGGTEGTVEFTEIKIGDTTLCTSQSPYVTLEQLQDVTNVTIVLSDGTTEVTGTITE